jgi:hypothetical protein
LAHSLPPVLKCTGPRRSQAATQWKTRPPVATAASSAQETGPTSLPSKTSTPLHHHLCGTSQSHG